MMMMMMTVVMMMILTMLVMLAMAVGVMAAMVWRWWGWCRVMATSRPPDQPSDWHDNSRTAVRESDDDGDIPPRLQRLPDAMKEVHGRKHRQKIPKLALGTLKHEYRGSDLLRCTLKSNAFT